MTQRPMGRDMAQTAKEMARAAGAEGIGIDTDPLSPGRSIDEIGPGRTTDHLEERMRSGGL